MCLFPQIYEMGALGSASTPEQAKSVFTGSSDAGWKEKNLFFLFFA